MDYVRETALEVFCNEQFMIGQAIKAIQNGLCKRVHVSDRIKVYECNNVIRIDIKE